MQAPVSIFLRGRMLCQYDPLKIYTDFPLTVADEACIIFVIMYVHTDIYVVLVGKKNIEEVSL